MPLTLLFSPSQKNSQMPENLAMGTSTILLLMKSRKEENKIEFRKPIRDYQTWEEEMINH